MGRVLRRHEDVPHRWLPDPKEPCRHPQTGGGLFSRSRRWDVFHEDAAGRDADAKTPGGTELRGENGGVQTYPREHRGGGHSSSQRYHVGAPGAAVLLEGTTQGCLSVCKYISLLYECIQLKSKLTHTVIGTLLQRE